MCVAGYGVAEQDCATRGYHCLREQGHLDFGFM
jgi:hypothetical protein